MLRGELEISSLKGAQCDDIAVCKGLKWGKVATLEGSRMPKVSEKQQQLQSRYGGEIVAEAASVQPHEQNGMTDGELAEFLGLYSGQPGGLNAAA